MGFICPRCKTDFENNKIEFDKHIYICDGKKDKPKGNHAFHMTCSDCGARVTLSIDKNNKLHLTKKLCEIKIDYDGNIIIRCLQCSNEIRFDAGSYEGSIPE
jgi:DNA-directed RNA polymerase subunit RPC12/RpoP